MWKRMHFISLAMMAGLISVGNAQASTVYFEFTGDTPIQGFALQQVYGTVTGHIDGLVDNATSSATAVFVDSAPTPLHFDYSLNLVNSALFGDTYLEYNRFTLKAGNIEDYYFDTDHGSGGGVYFRTGTTALSSLPFSGLTVEIGNTFPGVVTGSAMSFSSTSFLVSPVPLPAGLPMFATALLGLIGVLRPIATTWRGGRA